MSSNDAIIQYEKKFSVKNNTKIMALYFTEKNREIKFKHNLNKHATSHLGCPYKTAFGIAVKNT